jgi:hypothetical protein
MIKINSSIIHFCFRPKKVSIHGTEYRVGAVITTGDSEDQLPEFASISKIIVTPQNKIFLLLVEYITFEFSSHYHSFEVHRAVNPTTYFACKSDFLTYLPAHTILPFGAVSRNGASYVAPRYSVPIIQ